MKRSNSPAKNQVSEPTCTCGEDTGFVFVNRHLKILLGLALIAVALLSGWLIPQAPYVTIGFYLAVVIVSGHTLLLKGLKRLVRLKFDMNTLMTLAVIGGFILGEWLEIAVVVVLFAIGEALESFAVNRAEKAVGRLLDQAPQEALVETPSGWQMRRVETLTVGMRIRIRSGAAIPLDGIVVAGLSAVMEAAITGESMPVDKQSGDRVYAGTLNQEGTLDVEVTAERGDTRLARIVRLVEQAQTEKSTSETLINRFAKVYTPLVMVLASGVMLIPPLFFGQMFSVWFYQGLAVLLIGCPCALIIATPTAVVAAHANAAQAGILIKGGIHLENLGRLDAIAFDKTGTLTVGQPSVIQFVMNDATRDPKRLLACVAALESRTQHPLATGLVDYVVQQDIRYEHITIEQFKTHRGAGLSGWIDGVMIVLRKPTLEEERLEVGSIDAIGTRVIVIENGQNVAHFILADRLRPYTDEALTELESLGIKTRVLLTGDGHAAAQPIAQSLGLKAYTRLMPEEKLAIIEQLKTNHQAVAMVGDGINDAPALALADVGIAMGAGASDTALETADVALLGDDLRKLPYAIALSRRTHKMIWCNIVFALGLKAVTLALVVPGQLTLWLAITADMGATLLVALNSLRLLSHRHRTL